MKLGRLRLGEWIAAASGVALLAVMLLDWYGGEPDRNAWETFVALDVYLALLALAAIALAFVTASQPTAAVPIAFVSVVTLLGLVATVWLLLRVLFLPGAEGDVDTTRLAGLWLGFLATLGITVGGALGMRDESPGLREPKPWEAPERAPDLGPPLPAPDPSGEQPAAR